MYYSLIMLSMCIQSTARADTRDAGINLSKTDEDPREDRWIAMKEGNRFRSEDAGNETLGS